MTAHRNWCKFHKYFPKWNYGYSSQYCPYVVEEPKDPELNSESSIRYQHVIRATISLLGVIPTDGKTAYKCMNICIVFIVIRVLIVAYVRLGLWMKSRESKPHARHTAYRSKIYWLIANPIVFCSTVTLAENLIDSEYFICVMHVVALLYQRHWNWSKH